MQTAERKLEYRPIRTSHSPAGAARTAQVARVKRTVKMDGNVAYIIPGDIKKPRAASVKVKETPARKSKPKIKNNDFISEKKARAVRGGAKVSAKPKAASAIVTKAKLKKARAGAVSTLLIAVIAFCAMAFLVSRYAALCSIGAENNKLESSINSIQTQIEKLKVDMEMKGDLAGVQSTAKNVLGMTYPADGQMITIGAVSPDTQSEPDDDGVN